MSFSRRNALRLISIMAFVGCLSRSVHPASAAVDPVNKNFFGTAMQGYDPVAYFKEGKPIKGKSEFRDEWMGAKWYFANAANRDEFAKEPAKYAPQFGGYCAWAVSRGYTANIDPEAWKIIGGKLYLNYNKDVQKMWEQDTSGNIKKGDENWPRLIKK